MAAARRWRAVQRRHQQREGGIGSAAVAVTAGGGSSAVGNSGEAGLQGGSDGGGRAVAFICTSFPVYEFIFFVNVSMKSSNPFFPMSYK